MYYEGIEDKLYLIRCNLCDNLLKLDRTYIKDVSNESCTLIKPVICKYCGNKSSIIVRQKCINGNSKSESQNNQKTTNINNEIKCPKCGSVQIQL